MDRYSGFSMFGDLSPKKSLLNMTSLGEGLENLIQFCPCEFARKPRSVALRADWKGTEY